MSELVFVKPGNDNPALVLARWATTFEWMARPNGHRIVQSLSGAAVTRLAVDACLGTGDAFFYFGHGTWTTLEGPMALVDSKNVASLNGRLVIAIACQAAHTLGPSAVKSGATCFLGFNDDLLWAFPVGGGDPFGRAFIDGLRLLLTGSTAGSAHQALDDAFKAIFLHYKFQSTDPNQVLIYVLADWDRRHVILCGQATAKLP